MLSFALTLPLALTLPSALVLSFVSIPSSAAVHLQSGNENTLAYERGSQIAEARL
jgi:hypothetical protein